MWRNSSFILEKTKVSKLVGVYNKFVKRIVVGKFISQRFIENQRPSGNKFPDYYAAIHPLVG
jgi:hypothetical protein